MCLLLMFFQVALIAYNFAMTCTALKQVLSITQVNAVTMISPITTTGTTAEFMGSLPLVIRDIRFTPE